MGVGGRIRVARCVADTARSAVYGDGRQPLAGGRTTLMAVAPAPLWRP